VDAWVSQMLRGQLSAHDLVDWSSRTFYDEGGTSEDAAHEAVYSDDLGAAFMEELEGED